MAALQKSSFLPVRKSIRSFYISAIRKILATGVFGLAKFFPGMRIVVVTDSFLWTWGGLPRRKTWACALRRLILLHTWSPVLSAPHLTPAVIRTIDREEVYRGVPVWEAIQYILCAELELHPAECHNLSLEQQRTAAHLVAEAKKSIDKVHDMLSTLRPDAVLCCQGYGVIATACGYLAPGYGVQCMSVECTFDSKRIICEPFTGIAVNRTSASLFSYQRRLKANARDGMRWLRKYLDTLSATKTRGIHFTPNVKYKWPEKRPRILFLAQVYVDSSVMFGMKENHTPADVIRRLIGYAVEKNATLFIKLHPKELNGEGPTGKPLRNLTLRKIQQLPGATEQLRLAQAAGAVVIDEKNEFGTDSLIAEADLVVTINSQGGLEAVAHGKPVMAIGTGFYTGLGFTFDLPSLSLLEVSLDHCLSLDHPKPNTVDFSSFLRNYLEDYCVSNTPKEFAKSLSARTFKKTHYTNLFYQSGQSTTLLNLNQANRSPVITGKPAASCSEDFVH